MAYQKHKIAELIGLNPNKGIETDASEREKAVEAILKAYRKAGCHEITAAEKLKVSQSTFRRWVAKLKLGTVLKKLKKQALAEGWHHEETRGKWQRPAA